MHPIEQLVGGSVTFTALATVLAGWALKQSSGEKRAAATREEAMRVVIEDNKTELAVLKQRFNDRDSALDSRLTGIDKRIDEVGRDVKMLLARGS